MREGAVRGERELVDEQYSGERALLRPMYERVVEMARGLGGDVSVAAAPDDVTIARAGRVFALVRPESATIIDLGLSLRDPRPHDRLIPTAALGEGVGFRVPLEHLDDVDGEVLRWLAQAYEQAGG